MILRLLRQKGVLGEVEYQAALAQSPNVGRLQQKVDENINTPPVFASLSSARMETTEKPIEKEEEKQVEIEKEAPIRPSGSVPTNPAESQADKK
jgi:monofunctional biosynthetic peptidoglycan transglycosylase